MPARTRRKRIEPVQATYFPLELYTRAKVDGVYFEYKGSFSAAQHDAIFRKLLVVHNIYVMGYPEVDFRPGVVDITCAPGWVRGLPVRITARQRKALQSQSHSDTPIDVVTWRDGYDYILSKSGDARTRLNLRGKLFMVHNLGLTYTPVGRSSAVWEGYRQTRVEEPHGH